MDGLLVVDKPVGPTSHDVVARIRKAARERRVGHTGTLDPSASGVLPLVLGRATRLARFLSASDKTYEATIELGIQTDTYDSEGAVVGERHADPLPSREEIDRALDAFRGAFLQQPPVYSAKKIGGTRSYQLARGSRSGQQFCTGAGARLRSPGTDASFSEAGPPARRSAEREGGASEHSRRRSPFGRPAPAAVTVHSLDLIAVDGSRVMVRLHCSAGFYVRSLAHDLGQRLGTGAHLAALRRTRVGDLTLGDATPLDELERRGRDMDALIVPLGRMLPALSAVVLTGEGVRRARHGRDLGPSDFAGNTAGSPGAVVINRSIRLLNQQGDLVGVAEPIGASGLLHPSVVLV
jgi:tRNA pseudouridine55 synthase